MRMFINYSIYSKLARCLLLPGLRDPITALFTTLARRHNMPSVYTSRVMTRWALILLMVMAMSGLRMGGEEKKKAMIAGQSTVLVNIIIFIF